MTQTQTHAWRIRLNVRNQKEHDLLYPAIFEMDGVDETSIKMEIIFSMTDFALFMVACSLLPKPVDITKLDIKVIDLKDEPERIIIRGMTPRPITKLRIQPKED